VPGSRIVSLLPSATEILCALGLRDRIVGVSHECDHPSSVRGLPVVTATHVDAHASSDEIDRQVRDLVGQGLSLYRIDEAKLRELAPDLIVTQDVCAVCAVSLAQVQEATCALLGASVTICSLAPKTVQDVLDDMVRVAEAAGVPGRGQALRTELEARLQRLAAHTAAMPRPTTLFLEWLDPPMVAGHWTPELLRFAGGEPILGHDGAPTGAIAWSSIVEADPEVLILAPCGFPIAQTLRELPKLATRPGFCTMRAVRGGQVYAVDGNQFFNRPGPRLIDSAEIAAAILHPGSGAARTWSDDIVSHLTDFCGSL
jgi:iron complex transport system substrate-binding protein